MDSLDWNLSGAGSQTLFFGHVDKTSHSFSFKVSEPDNEACLKLLGKGQKFHTEIDNFITSPPTTPAQLHQAYVFIRELSDAPGERACHSRKGKLPSWPMADKTAPAPRLGDWK